MNGFEGETTMNKDFLKTLQLAFDIAFNWPDSQGIDRIVYSCSYPLFTPCVKHIVQKRKSML